MNVMTVDGYHAKIEYDEELDLFRGEVLGINGGADFYGKNPKELRAEFMARVQASSSKTVVGQEGCRSVASALAASAATRLRTRPPALRGGNRWPRRNHLRGRPTDAR